MDDVIEEWRGWRDGNYEVSNLGNVRRATPGRRTWAGRPCKLYPMKIGYLAVNPVVSGKNVLTLVHWMVAEAFIGPRPEGHEINHKDGDKKNNHVSNLEYVTHRDNMRHAHDSGLVKRLGEKHSGSRFTNEDVAKIRADHAAGVSIGEQSRRYKCSTCTIFCIVHRKTWKHQP